MRAVSAVSLTMAPPPKRQALTFHLLHHPVVYVFPAFFGVFSKGPPGQPNGTSGGIP